MNLRKLLAEVMGKEQVTEADVLRELEELKIDNKLEALSRDGHLAADPRVQELARAAIKGQASAEQIEELLKAPRPLPAQTTTIDPPTGPAAGADLTENAIQAEMAKTGKPYHEAASVVSTGGALAEQGATE